MAMGAGGNILRLGLACSGEAAAAEEAADEDDDARGLAGGNRGGVENTAGG